MPGATISIASVAFEAAQRRVERAVRDTPERAQGLAEALAQLVAVEGLFFQQSEDGEVEHISSVTVRYIAPIYRGECIARIEAGRARGPLRTGSDGRGSPVHCAPCAGTPTTHWPDGPCYETCSVGLSPVSTSATRTPSSCGRAAISAKSRPTTARCAEQGMCGSCRTSTARSWVRQTAAASRTTASWRSSAPCTTSSPDTSSRCVSTVAGTTCRVASSTVVGTTSPRTLRARVAPRVARFRSRQLRKRHAEPLQHDHAEIAVFVEHRRQEVNII